MIGVDQRRAAAGAGRQTGRPAAARHISLPLAASWWFSSSRRAARRCSGARFGSIASGGAGRGSWPGSSRAAAGRRRLRRGLGIRCVAWSLGLSGRAGARRRPAALAGFGGGGFGGGFGGGGSAGAAAASGAAAPRGAGDAAWAATAAARCSRRLWRAPHTVSGRGAAMRSSTQSRARSARTRGQMRFAVETALTPLHLCSAARSTPERAREVFSRCGVWDTEHNNGVLIYVLLGGSRGRDHRRRGIAEDRVSA